MAKYQVIVTDVGRQKMMDAAVSGQKVKITHIAVGDGGGSEVVPKESWTKLTREVWRGGVSSCQIDPEREDGMRVYGIIPASSGGFTIREMGVFDEAGDLIAVSSTAAMQKPSVDSGMSMDMEIYQYILLATMENVQIIIDGNVVGATLQDVKNEMEKHNTDAEAHPKIKEKLDSLSDVAYSGSYNDLSNKPTIPAKTTVVNNLTSTSTTSALSAYQGKVLNEKIPTVTNSLTSTSTTSALSAAQGKVLKDSLDDLAPVASSGSYTDLTGKPTIPSVINTLTSTLTASALSAYQGKVLKGLIDALATVASTGSYSDLTGKPTIPSVINNLTSTSTTSALSAYQGKVLDDRIDSVSSSLNSSLKPVVGTFTGNGASSRLISLGFSPSAVILTPVSRNLWENYTAMGIRNYVSSSSTGGDKISITGSANGFYVYYGGTSAITNLSSLLYMYIAFR